MVYRDVVPVMRRSIFAALAIALLIAAPSTAAPAPDVEGSIAIVQTNPTFGSLVSFREMYPQEAAKQSRQNQYPGSPQTQVDCWQIGVPVYRAFHFPLDRTKIPGGWLAITNELTLQGRFPGGAYWLSGGADCRAVLFSNDSQNVQHIWAMLYFAVGP